jgi:hypothetical protein
VEDWQVYLVVLFVSGGITLLLHKAENTILIVIFNLANLVFVPTLITVIIGGLLLTFLHFFPEKDKNDSNRNDSSEYCERDPLFPSGC